MTLANLSFITLLVLWFGFVRLLETTINAKYFAQFRLFDLSQTLTPTRTAFFFILSIMFYGITLIKARHEAPNTSKRKIDLAGNRCLKTASSYVIMHYGDTVR